MGVYGPPGVGVVHAAAQVDGRPMGVPGSPAADVVDAAAQVDGPMGDHGPPGVGVDGRPLGACGSPAADVAQVELAGRHPSP
jgi:hypothetical protein